MNGFEAISYYNGWAQAVAGALIVMTGLSLLALIVSQLYKIVEFSENLGKNKDSARVKKKEDDLPADTVPDLLKVDINGLGELSRPYADKLGDSFQLRELYDIFQKNSLPHPHLTIRSLREAGKIVPLGDGMFCWNR